MFVDLKSWVVTFQVGELGSEEKEEAHESAGDDPEDCFLQNPILKRLCWSEVGALPVGVEYFSRIHVELVEEYTWKIFWFSVKVGKYLLDNTQACGEDDKGESGADEDELESWIRHTPVGKWRSNANLREMCDIFVAEKF